MTEKKPTPKKPQDHKPKATAETEATGAEKYIAHLLDRDWEVDAQRLSDDYEFLQLVSAFYSGGQATVITAPQVLYGLIGSEQHAELMELLRDSTTGKIAPRDAVEFTRDLLEAASPNS